MLGRKFRIKYAYQGYLNEIQGTVVLEQDKQIMVDVRQGEVYIIDKVDILELDLLTIA